MTLIRNLQEADIEELVRTFTAPWSTAEATTDKWKKYLQEQQQIRTTYVLVQGDQFVGYGSLLRVPESPRFREAGIPEINDLWIHEKNRGQGLGTMLIKHLEELARRENYPAIGIGVGLYADYGPAQRLYSYLGYTPDGHGITYKGAVVTPGEPYPVDDELILWSMKIL